MATQIVGSLLALEAMDEEAPIRMYINSPGGQPYSIIGVADAMTVGRVGTLGGMFFVDDHSYAYNLSSWFLDTSLA
jgi:hypothetical protein